MVRLLPLWNGRSARVPGLFFPGFSELAGTLAAFATFGVAFVDRPIGGVVRPLRRQGRPQDDARHHPADHGPCDVLYPAATFVLTCTPQLGLPRSAALIGVLIASALELLTMPAFGSLSDCVGRRSVILGGTVVIMLISFPFFWLVDTGNTILICLAIVLALSVSHAAVFGPIAAFFAELFGTRVRYSGTSVGFQLGVLVAGTPTPFTATALLAWSGGDLWPISLLALLAGLVTLVSFLLAAETFRTDLEEKKS